MKIYHYHPITGELLSEGFADPSPLEAGVFLIPANATEFAPPKTKANEVAVFIDNKWQAKPDHPPPPTPEQLEAEAARQKAIALANIKVTVNGKEFDGHTEARANMGHAIMLAGITGQTSTEWKLADNTFATVTVADLQQALLLSLTKYGEIIGAV